MKGAKRVKLGRDRRTVFAVCEAQKAKSVDALGRGAYAQTLFF